MDHVSNPCIRTRLTLSDHRYTSGLCLRFRFTPKLLIDVYASGLRLSRKEAVWAAEAARAADFDLRRWQIRLLRPQLGDGQQMESGYSQAQIRQPPSYGECKIGTERAWRGDSNGCTRVASNATARGWGYARLLVVVVVVVSPHSWIEIRWTRIGGSLILGDVGTWVGGRLNVWSRLWCNGAHTGDSNDHHHWGDGRPPLTPYSPSQASMMLISSKK